MLDRHEETIANFNYIIPVFNGAVEEAKTFDSLNNDNLVEAIQHLKTLVFYETNILRKLRPDQAVDIGERTEKFISDMKGAKENELQQDTLIEKYLADLEAHKVSEAIYFYAYAIVGIIRAKYGRYHPFLIPKNASSEIRFYVENWNAIYSVFHEVQSEAKEFKSADLEKTIVDLKLHVFDCTNSQKSITREMAVSVANSTLSFVKNMKDEKDEKDDEEKNKHIENYRTELFNTLSVVPQTNSAFWNFINAIVNSIIDGVSAVIMLCRRGERVAPAPAPATPLLSPAVAPVSMLGMFGVNVQPFQREIGNRADEVIQKMLSV